ncbi:MAG: Hsp20/alpha crystallin family protein [Thermoplasmata archaeon]|nr:Hsp20/alpha crystallin family protein [Thermoplasmata archaeon]
MVERKNKKDRNPFDWFDFPGWGFEDIFEDFDERFRKMQKYMNKIIRDAMEGRMPAGEGKPIIYGWSMRVGPDGKPHFTEFGNVTKERMLAEEPVREPLVDVIESNDKISVTAEVPGVEKKDINLEIIDNNKLIIKVETAERKYYKEVELPAEVDEKSAKATYQNGVLDVELKKLRPKKKGKKIEIK